MPIAAILGDVPRLTARWPAIVCGPLHVDFTERTRAVDHHTDGSVTLRPEEVGQLRALLDSVMAGNRIQATLSHKSQDEYQMFVYLRHALLSG